MRETALPVVEEDGAQLLLSLLLRGGERVSVVAREAIAVVRPGKRPQRRWRLY